MSTNQNPITAPQISKLIQSFAGVSAVNFQDAGVPVLYLIAEYLRQSQPRRLNLQVLHQVLGIQSQCNIRFAEVRWVKHLPAIQLSEHAVRPSRRVNMLTTFARIFPEDLGLISKDMLPAQVADLAMSWGFQVIPEGAFVALLGSTQRGRVVPGDMMAYLENLQGPRPGHCSLRTHAFDGGFGFEGGVAMERGRPEENWSILVASEITEVK